MKTKEVLCAQAALILWKGRKAIHQPGLSMLQSKCILEQDDVNRMQVGLSGFLSKRKRGYEEKLEKEMAEVAAAKEELERMQKLVAAADEKLPILELRARACTKEWEEMDASLLRGEEKEIYQWCQEAKKCVEVIKGVDLCIAKLKEMQANSMTVQLDSEPFLQLQKQIDLVWINAGAFVKELGEERQYDLSFLEEEDPALVKLAKTYSCRLTRSLATFDEVSEWMKTNNALFGLEEELQALRKELAEIFEDMAKVGEGYKADGEAQMPDAPSEDIYIEETPSTEKSFERVGLFGEVDLTKEKERVLFGLDLLRKEFLRITERVEKGDGMQHWLHHPEKKENEFLESINGWEKALREWQQDLKLYRKDAGNFSCALDGYTILEMKIWQYVEEDGAELQKACREHLQKTKEMLAETERQIREFEK